MNLTTGITSLAHSPDGAMLALASKDAKNALRVAHLDSCTVFENWPTMVSCCGHLPCPTSASCRNCAPVHCGPAPSCLWGSMGRIRAVPWPSWGWLRL